MSEQPVRRSAEPANTDNLAGGLVEILETVLDKGVVIAGDIKVNIADVELLTIKIRLVVASVDKAKEMGIDWWETDPHYSSNAKKLEDENQRLLERVEQLESSEAPQETDPRNEENKT
ncbi:gas vesicle protein [Marinococcus sp. PL1-022]|uniref:gas vesicle protein n=1 Tax=Marinococcus sp. PL1-022 TaxID=3095363 RepID=UPI0029C5C5A1|nr:gas vesicle protein [Marinococcus sp. PL1-022]MDX6154526.1 gas vesicle protein [Marinococcus sp. PL1-022]